ncbi:MULTISPECIES: hydroxyethylthiazole kinase [Aerococcus]|uniref:Hydroxyethylthiazole kinase n=2 Tax=Aerococcus TaxID=1375 RepID=A0A5N1GJI6_9LACT|nr:MULTISPECIES: hydroxyethylthiazole kinase [Aerococcus]KAA9300181.1 hydroxyethylthiazole kinase [Aerococcus sanguinicola]MDK6369523.1 hydroxyethylthiazole kinase [Aerococcus sp. UMB9870]MDK6680010.1 hydroxyethylthiazole kinase [Aerococcus sp. UMB8608]MDK6686108.1 hydroxyethylthiazole kinase [Aerococcus sp. UMB8623]MDK6939888.1 hydroxyethylthiazole kinase [Aerococcus sp. UMB8487]
MEKHLHDSICQTVQAVKEDQPLVPSITNTVTINLVANTQLAAGGSAAMVYLPDEGEAMAQAGEALYINMGTIFPIYEETLPRTVAKLNATQTPWVLDPVAVGMGTSRSQLLLKMREAKPAVIKGNASEIIAMAQLWELLETDQVVASKGVDSLHTTQEARQAALSLARHTGGAVVVSGETDLVTDGTRLITSTGGSQLMTHITGAGCALGGLIAVYATKADPLTAALTGVNAFNYAGSKAEKQAQGPASFQVHLLDELYQASPDDIAGLAIQIEKVD